MSSPALQAQRLIGCNRLILIGYLSLGGSGRQGYLLARALREEGMHPGVLVWTVTSEDFLRKHIREIDIPIAIATQKRGPWKKICWLRTVVQLVRPSVLHSMAFLPNSAAAWSVQGLPVIAMRSIRGDYRFEARQRPDLRARMGEAARAKAEAEFGLKQLAVDVLMHIPRLVGSGPKFRRLLRF